ARAGCVLDSNPASRARAGFADGRSSGVSQTPVIASRPTVAAARAKGISRLDSFGARLDSRQRAMGGLLTNDGQTNLRVCFRQNLKLRPRSQSTAKSPPATPGASSSI